jgi:hypothetical protein
VTGFLTWTESSALGHFMRESGPWTYALVNLGHLLGVSALFGSILLLDLTLMRAAWTRQRSQASLPSLAHAAAPLAAAGFVVAAATGIGLLSSNATEYQGNPFFTIKFPAIALAVTNAVGIRRSAAWRAIGTRDLTPSETGRLGWLGAASLACWTVAITAGRLIGYW